MYGVLTKETEDVQLGTLCFVLYVVMEDVPQGLDDADGEADVVGDYLGPDDFLQDRWRDIDIVDA